MENIIGFLKVELMDSHRPVLLNEMLELLSPKDGAVYVDATFGGGGYSRGILERAKCTVLAIDQDPIASEFYQSLHSQFPGRVHFFLSKFSRLREALQHFDHNQVDGVVFDVGVSSMQLSDPDRGFSFMKEGPLDMRMDMLRSQSKSAATFVNSLSEKDMADVIFYYGGERLSRRVARAIISARESNNKIRNTSDLAKIIRSVVPRSKANPIDPATRTFQAIRIWVNDELEELKAGLEAASQIVGVGGKIIVTSFHSLEDRIVKHKFNALREKGFQLINKKAIKPTEKEISENTRSRSAKLRGIVKEE
ncbi:16S rRNA (cytosine(1402)-N(4))-methyltransferase [Anaplasma phagocytophilum str. CR1007]|nr:16S rRNA methyltransferase [Anaplasma phagocytophilum str. JM]AGR81389.1 16S rRNA methyltransferase [Anaplasma phagocytophilum str. Dog2]EOA60999.1 16S rRNA m(4)C1402 methyltransferase [Anaplasma phagocytophilum str. HGE1]KJZ98209.1 16S rRNA (cytosine(1402)-N(4))-methyltransferase [Anaplasma phagocytophilum]KJZ99351.1 16S rRNA (cytosine(1402)-N(4))-methyltransferase [Anaplasma phagocytophilum str. CR1007]